MLMRLLGVGLGCYTFIQIMVENLQRPLHFVLSELPALRNGCFMSVLDCLEYVLYNVLFVLHSYYDFANAIVFDESEICNVSSGLRCYVLICGEYLMNCIVGLDEED